MRTTIAALIGLAVVSVSGPVAFADLTVTFSQDHLAARATFVQDGTDLFVTLENISTFDVLAPSDVLTAVYFDMDGAITLTKVRATLTDGSEVLFPPENNDDGLDANGEVGGEYAYRNNLSGPAHNVISGVGLDDYMGPNDLFPGTPLWGPPSDSPNGLGYGITSDGDDPTVGNAKVTGDVPLVRSGIIFEFSGLPIGYDLDTSVHNVLFNYGTEFSPTPAPSAMALGATGLAIAGWWTRRRRTA